MKNVLRINHSKLLIIMDRTYAKNAENTASPEYQHLQEVRRDYPNYTVVRKKIKKNPDMDRYKGLTYDYMRDYIILHSSREEEIAAIAEFNNLIHISKCHSSCRRYPAVKAWFLRKYPEVKEFGSFRLQDNDNPEEMIEQEVEKTAGQVDPAA